MRGLAFDEVTGLEASLAQNLSITWRVVYSLRFIGYRRMRQGK